MLAGLCHGVLPLYAQRGVDLSGTASAPVVTLRARQLWSQGPRYYAVGQVLLRYEGLRLRADRLRYNRASRTVTATGHVVFSSRREKTRITGTRAVYDLASGRGEFDNARGFSGVELAGRQRMLFSNNPFFFTARRLLRLGPDHYRIEDGTITSCQMPRPKWRLAAGEVDFTLGHSASLHNASFRFLGVPVFYFPYLTHSLNHSGRHSGFLLPVVGYSTVKGDVLGDAFFWAINRSWGLTLGGDLYSARGWAEHVALNSRPTRESRLDVQLDGVFDRQNEGGQELRIQATHAPVSGFRAVLDVDYLSSYSYRYFFQPSLSQAINTEAISTGFLEKQLHGYDLAVVGQRYQNFLSTTRSDQVTITTLPSLDWGSWDRRIFSDWPLYASWHSSFSLLDRSQPGFSSGILERLHLTPRLSLPWRNAAGAWRLTLGLDDTYYSEQQTPSGAPGPASQVTPAGINELAETADLRWRPPGLERTYNTPGGWLGNRVKHVIQPEAHWRAVTGMHNFQNIIQFDPTDILTDTQELDYGLTNRWLTENSQGQTRELVSWTLEQKYFFNPSFGGALTPGARNVFLTTAMLSPFAFAAQSRNFSPLSSILRVQPAADFDGEWRLDLDPSGRLAASAFNGNFHLRNWYFSGSHYLIQYPAGLARRFLPPGETRIDQLRLGAGYGRGNHPGWSLGAATAVDLHLNRLQYNAIETAYNWDCCGFAFEYRLFSLGTLSLQNRSEYLFSISLANIGSFGNLREGERLF